MLIEVFCSLRSYFLVLGRFLRDGVHLPNIFDAGYRFVLFDYPHLFKLTRKQARELTLEAAQYTGSARTINTRASTRDLPFLQVKKLLDSRNDREILEGLRKVISV